jgi:hypothetical protein
MDAHHAQKPALKNRRRGTTALQNNGFGGPRSLAAAPEERH